MSCATLSTIVTLPAFIDCHVHFREPGLEHKADMASESTAAFYGGISAACDMPNTNPPTQTIAALSDKVARAARVKDMCDLFFFFGATAEAHLVELEQLWTDPQHAALKARCCGLKLYLDNSTGNMKSSLAVTEAAFALCGRLRIPLVTHCEQAEVNDAAAIQHPYNEPASHSMRRPAESEVSSISEAIALARKHRTPLHIAHLSTAGGLEAVRAARRADPELVLTCEVAPHHLFLSCEDYACCGSRVKVNPPIRPRDHYQALWEGVMDGTVDCVATDHAPHTLDEKADVGNPPSGIPSIEVVVALLLTCAAGRWPHPEAPQPAALDFSTTLGTAAAAAAKEEKKVKKRFTVDDIVRLMHTNPSHIFGLGFSSTPLRRFDTACEWTVDEALLHSKCRWSPYHGWKLIGKALV